MSVPRPELLGTSGAVSSTHWLATAAGLAVLEQGGNAFDAVTAVGFVLQVVEPHSNGLGGDVSIVVQPAGGEAAVICGQGPTPAAATLAHFRSLGLRQVPGSGLLPACVPGAFGAWLRLLRDYGTVPLEAVMERAIGYAEHGYPLVSDAARCITALAPLFATEWPESGRTYLTAGRAPAPGDLVRNTALAATMRRILAESRVGSSDRESRLEAAHAAFYRGFVAESIDAFVRDAEVLDSTGRRHRCLLTGEDLATWRVTVERPVSYRYGRYTVHKPGPWSQGPVFAQQLALLDGIDLGDLGLGSGAYVHTLTEAGKLAFADREAWYGDPAQVDVPMAALLSADYNAHRRAGIGEKAHPAPHPGTPGGRTSWLPDVERDVPDGPIDQGWQAELQSGMPTVVLAATTRPGDTCAAVVVDRRGNLAAAVPSGGWLKSSPVMPGLGFPLGTRAQSMWLVDGHPNAMAPGKRPRTTLSPTVALRDDKPYLAFGTPGGDRQDVWTLEVFLAVVAFGLDLQAATEVTTFHSDHFASSFTPRSHRPGVLVVEASCSPQTVADLRRRGHTVDVVPEFSMGNKVCIVGADGALVRAGAGPRGRQAYAAVW
jgi:gamma-glutamyltranspeptidase/glutathione hydrolase